MPAYLPQGFQQTRSRVVQIHGQPAAVFAYSDGVSTLALFESRGPQGPPPRGRQVRIGSVMGIVAPQRAGTLVHWNIGGISYTLVGELPRDDLVRIAASVPAVTSRTAPFERAARAWLSALMPVAVASAAEAASPSRAWPGVPPVPVSPYITTDTRPIGPGLRDEEMRIWRAFQAAGLSPFVVKVTVASDGVSRMSNGLIGHLAWIWFVYGMDWTGGAGSLIREVQASERALAVTAFRAEPPGLEPAAALARAGDVWYGPSLLAAMPVMLHPRAHEVRLPSGLPRPVPAVPGDRTSESAAHFDGTLVERILETKYRLEGILFGVESHGRFWRGNPRRREIALTFDDGPSPVATPLLLAILRRYGAHATFFVIGDHTVPYPYLVKQMRAAGTGRGRPGAPGHGRSLAVVSAPGWGLQRAGGAGGRGGRDGAGDVDGEFGGLGPAATERGDRAGPGPGAAWGDHPAPQWDPQYRPRPARDPQRVEAPRLQSGDGLPVGARCPIR
ncbi:MAG: hypothetical protein E6H03_08210 [Bacillati bacterium ANGP1]|uniref:NodB homology domain-containing protein n=1 Tax=Candidatus Segetimicrobium genomatis TaxID=2569760 RepID=A0A537JAF1_9BACT|nr:MAG: hypothetical protein E6H03_08210 [Terrabacteria group bacterium ANGP1]